MILISGGDITQINKLPLSELERSILRKKESSPVTYRYDSPNVLVFELKMRSRIVQAAKDLKASGIKFAAYKKSKCNGRYWTRTDLGGFQLKSDILPSTGIRDIYHNGHLYATECTTAIIILMYKAIIDVIGEQSFNTNFKDLLLYDWQFDSDLRFIEADNKNEAYPGDVLYFENPDFNPETPEWRGENVIMLADDFYFGHGMGFKTSEGVIASLNTKRKPKSKISAFLTEQVLHPDFAHLQQLSVRESHIIIKIGTHHYQL